MPDQRKAHAIADQHRQQKAMRAFQLATKTVAIVTGVIAAPGEHPELKEELLDLTWKGMDGALLTTRFPLDAWPEIRDEIESTYTALKENPDVVAAAKRAGLHLPDGADLEREADAYTDLRGGTQSD
jgi:hypothetical protein